MDLRETERRQLQEENARAGLQRSMALMLLSNAAVHIVIAVGRCVNPTMSQMRMFCPNGLLPDVRRHQFSGYQSSKDVSKKNSKTRNRAGNRMTFYWTTTFSVL